MDIQSLRYFISVFRHLSFSKAARECFVTQPVISRKIAALEEEFQCVFFRRTRQGVLPTDCGKLFFFYAEETLSRYEDAIKSISQHSDREENTLSIAAVVPATTGFLPKAIAGLYAQYPGAQIVLDRYTPGEMQEVLLGDAYDFYITNMPDLMDHDDFFVKGLIHDGASLLTKAEDFPENDQQAAQLLRKQSIYTISRQDSPHFYNMVLEQLEVLGINQPILREIRPIELLSYCVSANMGVAMSPKIHGEATEGLCTYSFENGPEIELGIGWRELSSPLMSRFLDNLFKTLPR